MVKSVLNISLAAKMLKKIRPIFIFLPKISAYRRDFDETKYISSLIEDEVLLEMYNQILRKVKNNIENEFDSEPVYNEKYLRAKIKSYHNKKINSNYYNNKIPKEDSKFMCLSVILIDSGFYYQVKIIIIKCL